MSAEKVEPRVPRRKPGPKAPPGGRSGSGPKARSDRRKRETRSRLLKAAFVLMAQRGRDGVVINQITEAADVGFGSFYNHFESKEAIHAVVVEEVLNSFGEAVSQISERLDDPAEVLAASVRYVVGRAREEPLWGRFLLRSALSLESLSEGMGQYLMRDLERGLAAGRFASEDLLITLLGVGGTAVAAIAVEVEFAAAQPAPAHTLKSPRFEPREIPERTASAVLRVLGLPAAEADEIAHRPLPVVDLPPAPF